MQHYKKSTAINFQTGKDSKILMCGNCSGTTFFISECGDVACQACRCLMMPTPWDKVTKRFVELAYVPGVSQCRKCGFVVHRYTVHTESMSLSYDNKTEHCPNCNVPMWKVTERDWRKALETEISTMVDVQEKASEVKESDGHF